MAWDPNIDFTNAYLHTLNEVLPDIIDEINTRCDTKSITRLFYKGVPALNGFYSGSVSSISTTWSGTVPTIRTPGTLMLVESGSGNPADVIDYTAVSSPSAQVRVFTVSAILTYSYTPFFGNAYVQDISKDHLLLYSADDVMTPINNKINTLIPLYGWTEATILAAIGDSIRYKNLSSSKDWVAQVYNIINLLT